MSETTPRFEREFILNSLERSLELGSVVARGIDTPGVLAFYGGLGSGKTTLIQAIGRALGVEGPITSPTYTIINTAIRNEKSNNMWNRTYCSCCCAIPRTQPSDRKASTWTLQAVKSSFPNSNGIKGHS